MHAHLRNLENLKILETESLKAVLTVNSSQDQRCFLASASNKNLKDKSCLCQRLVRHANLCDRNLHGLSRVDVGVNCAAHDSHVRLELKFLL